MSKSHDGKNLPQFAALSNLNSSSLPACFVLKLGKSTPISVELLKKITLVTGIDFMPAGQPNPSGTSAGQPNPNGTSASQPNGTQTELEPLINLIAMSVLPESEKARFKEMVDAHAQSQSQKSNRNPKCFYTKLPDQEHCYYLGKSMNERWLEGSLITSIPFTHPTHVPQILVFLRQQVLFNVILGSCIRKVSSFSSKDLLPRFTFELSHQSISSVNVTFQHPIDDSLASLHIDMKDITAVKCRLFNSPWTLPSESHLISEDSLTRIIQRSLSIPITLRMIITKVREKYRQHKEAESLKRQERERFTSTPASAGGENDNFSQLMANYNNPRLSAASSKLAPQSGSAVSGSAASGSAASESAVTASPLMQLVSNLTTQQQLLKAAMASAEVATSTGNLGVANSLATEIQTRQRMVQTLLGQIAKQRQIEMARATAHAQASGMTSGGKTPTLSKQQQAMEQVQVNNAMLLNMVSERFKKFKK